MRKNILPTVVWGGLMVMLTLGFLLKFPCTYSLWGGAEYEQWCYSDIIALFGSRNLASGAFPYLETAFEYPVGIGLLAGLGAWLTPQVAPFFIGQAAVLALAAAAILGFTIALVGYSPRLLALALAPSLVLYAFHNWDLLAVAMMLLGLLAYIRGRNILAGVSLGIGAAIKFFPGLLVIGLILTTWIQCRRFNWQLLLGAVGSFLFVNLPIYLLNPTGWWYPWQFQSERFPNFETHWFFIYRHFGSADPTSGWWTTYPLATSGLSALLFFSGLGFILFLEWRRQRVRPVILMCLTVLLFLLTAKVFSPQYILWILPFLAILRFPWLAFFLVTLADLADWVAISHYFLTIQTSAGETALTGVEWAVGIRYLVLAWLAWTAYRLPEPVRQEAQAAAG